ncbi:hypothetical protein DFA_11256 [Cavenderia fasciculata]|uniref:Uncharacterized protein n=1 Tax=Cavenderia fasciculata TaxID=261658 RepID=F4QFP2_CACFS|nr:uncharacterized protein DFA_11256 [Cavenderia fasciculata]EGG13495.1 hypothetical protein DFA_11256 [Cavenderia fasciculata]|eukprot:XP_004350199.1 hypothetical protein DFA_11256 [Cavenderia fasciculata]
MGGKFIRATCFDVNNDVRHLYLSIYHILSVYGAQIGSYQMSTMTSVTKDQRSSSRNIIHRCHVIVIGAASSSSSSSSISTSSRVSADERMIGQLLLHTYQAYRTANVTTTAPSNHPPQPSIQQQYKIRDRQRDRHRERERKR